MSMYDCGVSAALCEDLRVIISLVAQRDVQIAIVAATGSLTGELLAVTPLDQTLSRSQTAADVLRPLLVCCPRSNSTRSPVARSSCFPS